MKCISIYYLIINTVIKNTILGSPEVEKQKEESQQSISQKVMTEMNNFHDTVEKFIEPCKLAKGLMWLQIKQIEMVLQEVSARI